MAADKSARRCRLCRSDLQFVLVDLGMSPLCERFLTVDSIDEMEPFFPLRVYVCERCFLVQLVEYVSANQLFSEYAYHSSFSDSWLAHMETYSEMVIKRFGLTGSSQVVEVASNDGYLLQFFVEKHIPVLGVEPAANVAQCAMQKGIPTKVEFFGVSTARKLVAAGKQADLLVGNNVLAHVPDLNDFVAGLKVMLKPSGVLTMEFPHVLNLLEDVQYDTIYHEHFSYFSFGTAEALFAEHGLILFDVEVLGTHGGSLRIYGKHSGDTANPVSERVLVLKEKERSAGLRQLAYYGSFARRVQQSKQKLLMCLLGLKQAGRSIVGYGAPGKGNTLLNHCGIRSDVLDYTVDRNPHKQGKFTPGSHIPIYPVEKLRETRPDYLLILPWNLKEEIMEQTQYIREWGGQFIIPIPLVRVLP